MVTTGQPVDHILAIQHQHTATTVANAAALDDHPGRRLFYWRSFFSRERFLSVAYVDIGHGTALHKTDIRRKHNADKRQRANWRRCPIGDFAVAGECPAATQHHSRPLGPADGGDHFAGLQFIYTVDVERLLCRWQSWKAYR